jgi:hypothetical protein
MRRLAALATLCFALTPAVAQGSSASRDGPTLRYHAENGEKNALSLHVEDPGNLQGFVIRLTDPGANIVAGANCQSVDAHTVICSGAASVMGVDIDLGDQDDSYTGSGAPAGFGSTGRPVQGGAGNDRITTAPSALERSNGFVNSGADGGPGNDELTGVEGMDNFNGGPGDDVIHGGGGDDRLRGGEGRDQLVAGTGADRVNGGPGQDRLELDGPDFAVGGPGDDDILSAGAQPATIVCGPGSDNVFGDPRSLRRPGPWLSRTCELYLVSEVFTPNGHIQPPWPVAASGDGRLVFRIPCSLRVCRGRLSIRSDRAPFRLLATRRIVIRHATRVALRLPRSAVRRARAGRTRLRVRLALPRELEKVVLWRFGLRL